jgi:hypothetical protein
VALERIVNMRQTWSAYDLADVAREALRGTEPHHEP